MLGRQPQFLPLSVGAHDVGFWPACQAPRGTNLKVAFPGHAITGTKVLTLVPHLLGRAYFLASAFHG